MLVKWFNIEHILPFTLKCTTTTRKQSHFIQIKNNTLNINEFINSDEDSLLK